jgi:hypothetical protein
MFRPKINRKWIWIWITLLMTLMLAIQGCGPAAAPEAPQEVPVSESDPVVGDITQPEINEPEEQEIASEVDEPEEQALPPETTESDMDVLGDYPGSEFLTKIKHGVLDLYFYATDDPVEVVLAYYTSQLPDYHLEESEVRNPRFTFVNPEIVGAETDGESRQAIDELRGKPFTLSIQYSDEVYMDMIGFISYMPQDDIPEGKTIIEIWHYE